MADFGYHYLETAAVELRKLKTLADRAIAQVEDEDLTTALDPESNSLAVLMRHVGGNLRSRFRDFLTTDGEKPDRDRDSEFVVPEGRPARTSWPTGRPAGRLSSTRSTPSSRPTWRRPSPSAASPTP